MWLATKSHRNGTLRKYYNRKGVTPSPIQSETKSPRIVLRCASIREIKAIRAGEVYRGKRIGEMPHLRFVFAARFPSTSSKRGTPQGVSGTRCAWLRRRERDGKTVHAGYVVISISRRTIYASRPSERDGFAVYALHRKPWSTQMSGSSVRTKLQHVG